MLSVCDKLHKIYSTTAEPIIWGRSVGVEVLNELETIKGAMMMSSGTGSRRRYQGQVGWGLAARGVESFAKTVDNARMLGDGLTRAASAAMKQLIQQGPGSSW